RFGDRVLELRNLHACAGFEGLAVAVIERSVGDLDRSSRGTFFVLFRQALDGDAVQIEPRQEETKRATSHPGLVKLVAVFRSTYTVDPLGSVRLFGARCHVGIPP